jgi:hypothetical protein
LQGSHALGSNLEPLSKQRGQKKGHEEMTKAERFHNSVPEELTDELLLAEARTASGQDPEAYHSARTEGAGEWYFHFDDGSILEVNIMEPNAPGLRSLTAQIPT